MKTVVFSTKSYDETFLRRANVNDHELIFVDARLTPASAQLAAGAPVVCGFVNDVFSAEVIESLRQQGTKLIALRCSGFNNVDLQAAHEAGMQVVRVPAYSPHAVAEFTMGLILALNRKIHRAHARVREGDFRLTGLLGFDLFGKTAGVVGTGAIGECIVRILRGFGCRVLACDIRENPNCVAAGAEYVTQDELFCQSDIVTLHCPLTPDTHHLINAAMIKTMKPHVMLINTGRGALVDTVALTDALKTGAVGSVGLDVYEEEADLFFEDHSGDLLQDDVFARLLTFPNVLITGHQAFFTEEALANIAETTWSSIDDFAAGRPLKCAVQLPPAA